MRAVRFCCGGDHPVENLARCRQPADGLVEPFEYSPGTAELTPDALKIVAAGLERNWAWLAHGRTNSILHTDLSVDDERRVLAEIAAAIAGATGQQPRGWMGPGLTETRSPYRE